MPVKGESMMDAIRRGEQFSMQVRGQFTPFVSPVDGSTITCKRELKEHNRKHDVVQVGTDFKAPGYSAEKSNRPNPGPRAHIIPKELE